MNGDSTLSLSAGDLRATFWPDAGMLCVSLQRGEVEFLRRIEDLESARRKGSTAGIPLLYPWANRLSSPHYRVTEREVELDRNSAVLHFDDHGLPMHGVPWGLLKWKVLEAKSDSVLARLDWNIPDLLAVFPFPHHVEIAAKLAPNSLIIQTTVFATSGSPVPISFGFHPYFGIPDSNRNEWHLQLPSMRKLQLDSRGIPTGAFESFGPFDNTLAETSFDDGFALGTSQSSFNLSGPTHNVAITFLEGFPYVQVFAPKEKNFIALEPMTGPTNALVSGEGLHVLQSGEQFRASFRVTIDSIK